MRAAARVLDWKAPRLGPRAVAVDDAVWWDKAFRGIPADLTGAAETLYADTFCTSQSNRAANRAVNKIREVIEAARAHGVLLDSTDDDIVRAADRLARMCYDYPGQEQAIAASVGVDPPSPMSRPRCVDPLWWRRRLRRAVGRDGEHAARSVGLVHRRAGCYASDRAVSRRLAQLKRNRRILESLDVVCGPVALDLDGVADRSLANPALRRAEIMTRIGGAEDYAAARGDGAMFVTVTVPRRYHARAEWGGQYDLFDGSSPRDGQAYLCRAWARVRAMWERLGLHCYGLRVAEPHHDGTPHWHLLLFCAPSDALVISDTLLSYFVELNFALWPSGYDVGARKHGLKVVDIDPEKGRAAGYVSKYIAKNIDGFGVDADQFGTPGAIAARRINAWASTWGIRQFQAWGMPVVGVWRELRRLREGVPAGAVGDCWKAADLGLWADYMRAQDARPVGLATAWSDKPNRYGEPRGRIVVGVEAGGLRVPTRLKSWSIRKRSLRDLGELSLTVRHKRRGKIGGENTTGSVLKKREVSYESYVCGAATKKPRQVGAKEGKGGARSPPN